MKDFQVVLNVSMRDIDGFDFNWLTPLLIEHAPDVIEMTAPQNKRLHYAGYKFIRGIPVRVVEPLANPLSE